MKKVLILVSTLALAACGFTADAQEGARAGATTQRSYEVGAFEGVALAGSQDVIVTVGGPVSVRAEGDAEAIEKMEVKVENGTLKIGNRNRSGLSFDMGRRAPVTVYVTVPSLSSAAVAGSGDMRIDKVSGDRFAAALAGSGDLEIAALAVQQANFSVAGSGDIRASGTAASIDASIAGSGDIDVSALAARQAKAAIVGSGNISAQASQTAQVSVMGSGNVRMAGGARCQVDKRGSGDVECG